MRNFIIVLVVSAISVISLNLLINGLDFSYESMSNTMFIIGLVMFFYGLLIVTNAWKIFRIVSYGFNSVLRRKKFKYKSFYDYMVENEKSGLIAYTFEILILGIVYLVIAIILAELVINSRVQDVLAFL